MSHTILITPGTLRAQAAQVSACAEEHRDAIERLTNLVISLDEVWKGEAQREFAAKFREHQETFRTFDEALQALSQAMQNTANRMESKDKELESRIRSIS